MSRTVVPHNHFSAILDSDFCFDLVSLCWPFLGASSYLWKSNVGREMSFSLTRRGYSGTAESSHAGVMCM